MMEVMSHYGMNKLKDFFLLTEPKIHECLIRCNVCNTFVSTMTSIYVYICEKKHLNVIICMELFV